MNPAIANQLEVVSITQQCRFGSCDRMSAPTQLLQNWLNAHSIHFLCECFEDEFICFDCTFIPSYSAVWTSLWYLQRMFSFCGVCDSSFNYIHSLLGNGWGVTSGHILQRDQLAAWICFFCGRGVNISLPFWLTFLLQFLSLSSPSFPPAITYASIWIVPPFLHGRLQT